MLKAIGLSRQYNRHTALNNFNLTVKSGEIYCLLGPDGAGKSTLINIFINFIQASSGNAFINGMDVSVHPSETKKYLTYIPANMMFYPALSGLENLDLFCRMAGKRYEADELGYFLEQAGIDSLLSEKKVSVYPRGMRQKMGIALAMAKNAKVLLLDEALSCLDPESVNDLCSLLLKMKALGAATLMTTRDPFLAKEAGTHIGIMTQGKLIESFSSDHIDLKDMEYRYEQAIKRGGMEIGQQQ